MDLVPHIRQRFSALDGRIYLNAASEGPMPQDAVHEAVRVARLKERPWEIGTEYYYEVPASVRARLEQWIGAPAGSVALVGGTSAGIGLAARGLPISPGDEVLRLEGQFPSNVYPWRAALERGATVRAVERPFGTDPTEAILSAIGPRTKIVTIDWVNFVDGAVVDLQAVGSACRQLGAFFVVDAAQGVGALRLDLSGLDVDVLAAPSHKWLLGPVGLGFVYVSPVLLETVQPWNSGWINLASRTGFRNLLRLDGVPPADATRFETGSPPYSLLSPWRVSLELLAETGAAEIERHVLALAEKATQGILELSESRGAIHLLSISSGSDALGPIRSPHRDDPTRRGVWTTPAHAPVSSSGEPPSFAGAPLSSARTALSSRRGATEPSPSPRPLRSGIVAFHAGEQTLPLYRALESGGVTVAFREGAIRISPHVYNTEAEIDAFLDAVWRFF